MSEQDRNITRRKFISTGIRGVGLVGLGGTVGVVASRYLTGSTDENPIGVGNAPTAHLGDYSKVDPARAGYEEVGQIRTKFQSLRGIAVGPDDHIYIAADQRIGVFGKDTSTQSELKLNGSPRCLTVTEEGTVYVGLKDRVEVYNAKGRHEASWDELGQNAVLTSIAVSKDDVFVANAGEREVLRYHRSGKFIRHIGKKDKARNIPGFVVPSPYFDLAVAPDGLLRVVNPGRHRVEAYTFDGDFELSWGETSMRIEGFCGCCNPVNFALLPDGKFVTSEKGLPRIKVYDVDGTFVEVVAGPEHFNQNQKACCPADRVTPASLDDVSNCQSGGLDVAVDSQGRVLVLDPVERIVRIFKPIKI